MSMGALKRLACFSLGAISVVGCSPAPQLPSRAERIESVATCARATDGLWCSRWQRGALTAASRWSAEFGVGGDSPGAADVFRTPDLDGDGQTDICIRDASGLACAVRSASDSFGPALRSAPFSDVDGFGEWSAASTIAFADVDGDGTVDACARRGTRLSCAHGRGDGRFDIAKTWLIAAFGDGDDPLRRATTRFGDVNGDGFADVCVNGLDGVRCALSRGDHFDQPTVWTDAFARDEVDTEDEGFELVDIDRALGLDICGVQDSEVRCASSHGSRFDGISVRVPTNGDRVVRFADVDGDRRDDICLFSSGPSRCATSRSEYAAALAWDTKARTVVDPAQIDIELVDINADGLADRCELAPSGLSCALSDGRRFSPSMSASAFIPGSAPIEDVGLATMAIGERIQPTAIRVNSIVLENQRAGTENWWIPYPQWSIDHEVEAYTDRLSYAPGDEVHVMLSTAIEGDLVHWRLLRTGWYHGRGARLVLDGQVIGHPQPLPSVVDPHKPVRAQWRSTFTLTVPHDAVSGVYALRLDSSATGKSSFVTLVVRRDGRAAAILFDRADFTDEAYNDWDGHTNQSSAYHNAFYVSLDRPLRSVAALGIFSYSSGYFVYEYPMVRWLEEQGYDVAYVSDADVDERFDQTAAHVFLSVGHHEYWSAAMRDNVEGARDRGMNIAFFGSDAVDGVIRFAPRDHRTFSTTISDQTWLKNESALKPLNLKRPPHENPSDSLTGTHYSDWCKDPHPECGANAAAKLRIADDFVVLALEHPIFRGVDVSGPLREVVGYEYETPYAGAAQLPFQLTTLAETVGLRGTWPAVMVAYRSASGALVVNLGSMHWAHALDGWTGRAAIRASGDERPCAAAEIDCFERHDLSARQVTLNILTDLGVPPATPVRSLKPTSQVLWP